MQTGFGKGHPFPLLPAPLYPSVSLTPPSAPTSQWSVSAGKASGIAAAQIPPEDSSQRRQLQRLGDVLIHADRLGGLRILGLGGSMRYNRGVNQYTEKQMRQRVQKLRFKLWRSGGIDILMTHSPARSLGDDTDLAHTGFKTFLDVMEKYRPRYMVHGHVHQNYQYNFKRVRHHGDTTVINAFGYYLLDVPVTEHS